MHLILSRIVPASAKKSWNLLILTLLFELLVIDYKPALPKPPAGDIPYFFPNVPYELTSYWLVVVSFTYYFFNKIEGFYKVFPM